MSLTQTSPTQMSPTQTSPIQMSLTANLSAWDNLTSPLATTNLTSSLATTNLNQTWPPVGNVGYLTLFGVSGVLALSILGNGLVIVSFFRDVRLRVIFNLFVVHLATADVIMSFLVVLTLTDHVTHLSLLSHWPLLCHVCTVLSQAIPLEQVVLLHLICHDRRRALRLGLSYSRHTGQWHVQKMLLVLTWVVTVVFSFLMADVMSTVEHFSYRSCSLQNRLVYIRYSSFLHLLFLASLVVNVAYITWDFRERRRKGPEFEPLPSEWEQEPTFHVQFPNSRECPSHTGCLSRDQGSTLGQFANHGQCPADNKTGVLLPRRHPPLVPRAALTEDFECSTLQAASTRSFRGVVQMMLSTHRPRDRRQSQNSLDGPSRLVDTNNHRNCFPRKSAIFERVTETVASRRHDQESVIITTATTTRVAENSESTDKTKNQMQPKENPRKASASFSGALTVQGSINEKSTRFSFYSHPSGSPRMDRYSVSRSGHNRRTHDALKTRISSNLMKPSLSSPTCGCYRFSTEGGHENRAIPPGSYGDEDDRKTSLSYCLRTDDWVQCRDVFSTLNFAHRSVPNTVCKRYSCLGPDLTEKADGKTALSYFQNFDLRPLSKSANGSTFRVSEYLGLVSEGEMIHRSPSENFSFKSIPLAASIDGGFSLLATSEVDIRHPAVLSASRVKCYLTCHSGFHSESSLLLWEPSKGVNVSQVSCLSSDVKHHSQSDGEDKLVIHPGANSKEIVIQRGCTPIMATQSANTVLKSSHPESSRVTVSQVDSPASIISQSDNTSVVTCQPYTAANLASRAPSADCCTSQPDYPCITAEQAKTTRSITTQLYQTDLPVQADFFQPEASVELVSPANYTNSDPEKANPDLPLASSLSQPNHSQADLYVEAAPCQTRDSVINENNNADSDESLSKTDTNTAGKLEKDVVVTGGRSTLLHGANHIGSFNENSENLDICETVNLHPTSTQTGSLTRPSLPLVLVDDKAKTSRKERTKDTKVFSHEFTPSSGRDSFSPQRRIFRGELSDDTTKSNSYKTDLSQADLEVARNNWLQFYGINAATISLLNIDSTSKSSFQHSSTSSPAEDSLAAARRIWLDFYGISNISHHDFSSCSSFPSQSANESFPNGHLSTELTNTVRNIPPPKPLLKSVRSDTKRQNLEELTETRHSTKQSTENTTQHPGSIGLRSSQSAEFRIVKSHRTRLESVAGAMRKKLKMSSSAHAKRKTEQAELLFSPAGWPHSRSAPLKRLSVATSKHYSNRKPSSLRTTQGDVLAETDMSKETVTHICGLLGHQLLDTAGQTSGPMASPSRSPDFPGVVSDQGGSGASREEEGDKAGLSWAASSFQDIHTIRSSAPTQNRTRTPVSKQRDIKATEDTVSLSTALGTKDELRKKQGGLNRRLDAPQRQDSFYCPNKLDSLDPISPVPFVCQELPCSSDQDEYNTQSLAGSPHQALHQRHLQVVGSENGLSHASPLASSDCPGCNWNQEGSCEIQNPIVTKDLTEGATGLQRRAELPMQVEHEATGCSPIHTVESWSVTSRALLVELGIYQDVLTGAIPLDLNSLARRETRCSVPPCPDCQKRAQEHRQKWLALGVGLGPEVDEDAKSNRSNNALTDVFQQGMTIVCHQLPSSSRSSSSAMTAGDTSAEHSGQDSGSQDSGQDSCLLVLPGLGHQVGGMTRDRRPISSSSTHHKLVRPPRRWSCPCTSKHLWKVLSFEQLKKRDAELSILISLICLVLLQLFCWLPIAVTYLVYDITGFPPHVTATELVFLLIWCARMAIQPLLYAYYSAFFRENYSQLVCCS